MVEAWQITHLGLERKSVRAFWHAAIRQKARQKARQEGSTMGLPESGLIYAGRVWEGPAEGDTGICNGRIQRPVTGAAPANSFYAPLGTRASNAQNFSTGHIFSIYPMGFARTEVQRHSLAKGWFFESRWGKLAYSRNSLLPSFKHQNRLAEWATV